MTDGVTDKVFLPDVLKELKALEGRSVIVGPVGEPDSLLAKYAAANEFGATISPKNRTYLAIPVNRQAKGKRPGDFADLRFVPAKNRSGGWLVRGKGPRSVAMFKLVKQVKIPERAFLRRTADSKEVQDKTAKILAQAVIRLICGNASADDVLAAIGESLSAGVKSTIEKGLAPANSPVTLLTKRGSTPLVDSGRLFKSISWESIC